MQQRPHICHIAWYHEYTCAWNTHYKSVPMKSPGISRLGDWGGRRMIRPRVLDIPCHPAHAFWLWVAVADACWRFDAPCCDGRWNSWVAVSPWWCRGCCEVDRGRSTASPDDAELYSPSEWCGFVIVSLCLFPLTILSHVCLVLGLVDLAGAIL